MRAQTWTITQAKGKLQRIARESSLRAANDYEEWPSGRCARFGGPLGPQAAASRHSRGVPGGVASSRVPIARRPALRLSHPQRAYLTVIHGPPCRDRARLAGPSGKGT